MNQKQFEKMSVSELKAYIKEQEPIRDKKTEEAYNAPNVNEFQRLSEIANEPIWRAGMQLRKITTEIVMKKHEKNNYGDLMTFDEFKECCESGGFIDYDGSGNYATADEESNITINPSDIEEGVYRTDFTHVMWYNR